MPEATTVATTAPVVTTTAAPAAGDKPWYDGADSAIIGHLQTHGWDKKTPNEAALEAAKSHFNLQKLTGAPADRLAKIPDAGDSEGWKAFFQKIGVPADPKAYDFKTIKKGDGTEIDAKTSDWLRAEAAKLNLRPQDAVQWAQDFVKQGEDAQSDAKAEATAKTQEEVAKLDKNWGTNKDANLVIARLFAQNHGVKAEVIDALQKSIGYADTMEFFRSMAVKTGEASFIGTQRPGGNGPMTRDEASARYDELMSDAAWKARYSAGGKRELNEMMAVNAIRIGRGA